MEMSNQCPCHQFPESSPSSQSTESLSKMSVLGSLPAPSPSQRESKLLIIHNTQGLDNPAPANVSHKSHFPPEYTPSLHTQKLPQSDAIAPPLPLLCLFQNLFSLTSKVRNSLSLFYGFFFYLSRTAHVCWAEILICLIYRGMMSWHLQYLINSTCSKNVQKTACMCMCVYCGQMSKHLQQKGVSHTPKVAYFNFQQF